jgi:hypothetical protein
MISACTGSNHDFAATETLRHELSTVFGHGNVFEVLGVYKGQSEISFIVFTDNVTMITALGKIYGQESILTNDALIMLQTGIKQRVIRLDIDTNKDSDSYTVLPGGERMLATLERRKTGHLKPPDNHMWYQ